MGARDWYVPLKREGAVRLIAFPHAGAGSARLSGFAKAVGPDLAVWAANLPGRQARVEEPPRTDLATLVDELATELAELAHEPYALLGYCSGALQAFLLARTLRDRGLPPPVALVVVSFEAPDIGLRPQRMELLPSARLWSQLIAEGGVGADLTEQVRLRRMVEPAVRADFAMLAGYRYTTAPPLPCPIVVCFGTEDPTPRGAWLGWRRQSEVPVRLRPVPGDHWLVDHASQQLATAVADEVMGGAR